MKMLQDLPVLVFFILVFVLRNIKSIKLYLQTWNFFMKICPLMKKYTFYSLLKNHCLSYKQMWIERSQKER